MIRAVFASALLVVAATGAPGGQDSPPVRVDLEVHRVLWPVLVEPRAGAGTESCRALSPRDVLVTEDGTERIVTSIRPARPRTLHAIVVDVSGSMEGRLDEARQAASDYVDALPGDEPVALFSFSDEVRLLSSPTLDRERIHGALARLAPVYGTALWDALAASLDVLAAWPERKAILLVTDGADTASIVARGPEDVLERLGSAGTVTVFPLALGMDSRADRGPRAPRHLLRLLAAETGGSLLDVADAAHFRHALDDIRGRLDAEWTVAFVSPTPGGGGEVTRAVRVRSRPGAVCRVRSAGPRTRAIAGPRPAARPPGPRADPGDWARIGLEGTGAADLSIGFAPPRGWPDEPGAGIAWLQGRRYGLLRWTSVTTERGHLLDPRRQKPGRRPRTRDVPAARFGPRNAAILVPASKLLEGSIHDLADALALAREQGRGLTGGAPDRPEGLAPLVWDGTTFLSHRTALADALVRSREDLARFAEDRIARVRRHELFELARDAGGDRPLDEARRKALEQAARHAARSAGPALRARFVAAWLPDIDAIDLALELERRALLAPDADEARRWLSLREELGALLPLPFFRRSVVFGVPIHDIERDVIGFQPIRLARLTVRQRVEGAIPPAPLAWLALRELAGAPDEPLAGFAPRSIGLARFDPPRGVLALWGRALIGRRETRWVLDALGDGPSDRVLALVELAAGDAQGPAVRVACASTGREDWNGQLARLGLLCEERWRKRLAERANRG